MSYITIPKAIIILLKHYHYFMKSILQMANDSPRLSQHDLDVISRAHDQRGDRSILKKDGLQGMEKLENWGLP